MEYQDQQHIDRVLKGDHRAFALLVDKYKYMAYTLALRIVDNESDAEDIAQESFVKAYRQLHTFEWKSKFSTWLYTIVYRTAVSKWQGKSLETEAITEEIAENYVAESPSIDPLEVGDVQRYVDEAIQKLPKLEALVITLYYLEEHSIAEIQAITGLSAENVKIKLYRARKKLAWWLRFLR